MVVSLPGGRCGWLLDAVKYDGAVWLAGLTTLQNDTVAAAPSTCWLLDKPLPADDCRVGGIPRASLASVIGGLRICVYAASYTG